MLIELVDLTEAPRGSLDMIILEPITNAHEFRNILILNFFAERKTLNSFLGQAYPAQVHTAHVYLTATVLGQFVWRAVRAGSTSLESPSTLHRATSYIKDRVSGKYFR